jgi:hypothetical protein
MKPKIRISPRNVASAENWWTGSRCDPACPRSGHSNRGRFDTREKFRRLTLRPAAGLSQREKHHPATIRIPARQLPKANARRRIEVHGEGNEVFIFHPPRNLY